MKLFWKAVNLHVMQAYWRKWTPRGRPWGFTAWLYSQSTLCFLPAAAVWPVAPCSWRYAFPAIMDSALQLWDTLSIPSLTPSGFFARCVTTAMTAIKITSTDAVSSSQTSRSMDSSQKRQSCYHQLYFVYSRPCSPRVKTVSLFRLDAMYAVSQHHTLPCVGLSGSFNPSEPTTGFCSVGNEKLQGVNL